MITDGRANGSDTIVTVSRLLKVLVIIVLAIMLAREIEFRRNLSEFNPETAPYGD